MKKVIILIIILLCCGCIKIKYNEGEYVYKGKKYTIKVDSNGSTGYSWDNKLSNEGIINIDRSYKTDCAPDLDGCGGQDVYKITGLKEGYTILNMKYCFSGRNCIEEKTYKFKVDKDLNLYVIEEK